MEEWEIYFFRGTKKGVVCCIFWCHFTFTANQLVVIEDTIFVTKPLFIITTPYQIHLRDINEEKMTKMFEILLTLWCNTSLFEKKLSDVKT